MGDHWISLSGLSMSSVLAVTLGGMNVSMDMFGLFCGSNAAFYLTSTHQITNPSNAGNCCGHSCAKRLTSKKAAIFHGIRRCKTVVTMMASAKVSVVVVLAGVDPMTGALQKMFPDFLLTLTVGSWHWISYS